MRLAWLTLPMHIRLVDRILRFQSRIIKRLTMNITKAPTKNVEGGSRAPLKARGNQQPNNVMLAVLNS